MAPSRNRRPGFSRRAQYSLFASYVIAVAGAVVGAGLLVLSTFDPVAFRALRAGAAELTTPLSSGMSGIVRGIVAVPEAIGNYIGVANRNVVVEKELKQMRALVMRARTLSYENRRLRGLLRVRDGIVQPVVAARLVNSSASSTRRYATLNAGDRQGVEAGQPVRGPDGLIGRVLSTGPNTSRVLLLADPESIVPVRRTRDGMPAFAAGRGDGLVELRSAAGPMIRFAKGEVFVTSGTGGIFPPGIPVARVIGAANDTALGRTFAQPSTFDYALVQRAFVDQPPPLPPADQP
jgi:rod shape-determining protein MreC